MALADLPSIDVLRAKLLGVIMAPATKLAAVINTPATQLARSSRRAREKAKPWPNNLNFISVRGGMKQTTNNKVNRRLAGSRAQCRPRPRMATRLKGNMADIAALVEQLSKLTVIEAADLVKQLETKWGVTAAAPVARGRCRPAAGAAARPPKPRHV
jgi:hypothetical protein